jgi:hypothetical protein
LDAVVRDIEAHFQGLISTRKALGTYTSATVAVTLTAASLPPPDLSMSMSKSQSKSTGTVLSTDGPLASLKESALKMLQVTPEGSISMSADDEDAKGRPSARVVLCGHEMATSGKRRVGSREQPRWNQTFRFELGERDLRDQLLLPLSVEVFACERSLGAAKTVLPISLLCELHAASAAREKLAHEVRQAISPRWAERSRLVEQNLTLAIPTGGDVVLKVSVHSLESSLLHQCEDAIGVAIDTAAAAAEAGHGAVVGAAAVAAETGRGAVDAAAVVATECAAAERGLEATMSALKHQTPLHRLRTWMGLRETGGEGGNAHVVPPPCAMQSDESQKPVAAAQVPPLRLAEGTQPTAPPSTPPARQTFKVVASPARGGEDDDAGGTATVEVTAKLTSPAATYTRI